jgi:4-diphosphocytidyl-2C-methyl-D-erythritol kinase
MTTTPGRAAFSASGRGHGADEAAGGAAAASAPRALCLALVDGGAQRALPLAASLAASLAADAPPGEPATALAAAGAAAGGGEALAPSVAFVRGALERFARAGDVQTCAVLSLVLQGRPEAAEPRAAAGWVRGYVELLHRHRLFRQAASAIARAADAGTHELSQLSTTVGLRCGRCEATLAGSGATCVKCARAGAGAARQCNRCAVCHQPVRGVYAWCAGCGHGGHVEHLREWFETQGASATCPAGCGHRCAVWAPQLPTGPVAPARRITTSGV